MVNYGGKKIRLKKPGYSTIQRTQKIFYVCCSRAKKKLVVFFPEPSGTVLNTAIEWFGKDDFLKVG